ncbi:MAG: Asp-tRNA(Asn)/Glu-tRNA(Gln) amidotransferase subunit GatC [Methanospirillum sp.]|nr:Asp-tRNA(Asn)/Glu-tRNA(Gln) amidotransferase subunit GatC [Methanospirillum sp.]
MVDEGEVRRIAGLADIQIPEDEMPAFTVQFNRILDYFEVLDTLGEAGAGERALHTVMRDDEPRPSLAREAVLANAPADEDGFIKAPRVM